MLDKYYSYKVKYNDYIIILKVGAFYETFCNDALIMNYLFKYKLLNIKNTYKCGFPLNSINKIKNILNLRNVNYIIISNTLYISEFKDNNYGEYNFNIDKVSRINRIITDDA